MKYVITSCLHISTLKYSRRKETWLRQQEFIYSGQISYNTYRYLEIYRYCGKLYIMYGIESILTSNIVFLNVGKAIFEVTLRDSVRV